jgi:two-component system osmolarity sensor histidine kinase EnvZ
MKANLIGDIKAITYFYNMHEHNSANKLAYIQQIDFVILSKKKISNLIEYPLLSDRDLKKFRKQLAAEFQGVEAFYTNDRSDITILLPVNDDVLQFTFSNKKIQSPTTLVFILWVCVSAFLLLTISIIFMKNQVRAIMNLSEVAERFGKGLESPRFKPSGATEVKKAGWAFLRMQRRIKRQILHRTELLSHISHDLRTPLTRIKLSLEMIKETKKDENLKTDIKEMETLISSYLDFAKEEGNEENKKVLLEDYILRIVKPFNNKKIKLINHCRSIEVFIKKEALKRALNNLINNALKHCKSIVKITLKEHDYNLFVIVEDDGNGIPKKYWKSVFKPFYKISSESDGYGLGLAIARTIVYNHGGTIKLDKSSLGGLKILIKLPI